VTDERVSRVVLEQLQQPAASSCEDDNLLIDHALSGAANSLQPPAAKPRLDAYTAHYRYSHLVTAAVSLASCIPCHPYRLVIKGCKNLMVSAGYT